MDGRHFRPLSPTLTRVTLACYILMCHVQYCFLKDGFQCLEMFENYQYDRKYWIGSQQTIESAISAIRP